MNTGWSSWVAAGMQAMAPVSPKSPKGSEPERQKDRANFFAFLETAPPLLDAVWHHAETWLPVWPDAANADLWPDRAAAWWRAGWARLQRPTTSPLSLSALGVAIPPSIDYEARLPTSGRASNAHANTIEAALMAATDPLLPIVHAQHRYPAGLHVHSASVVGHIVACSTSQRDFLRRRWIQRGLPPALRAVDAAWEVPFYDCWWQATCEPRWYRLPDPARATEALRAWRNSLRLAPEEARQARLDAWVRLVADRLVIMLCLDPQWAMDAP